MRNQRQTATLLLLLAALISVAVARGGTVTVVGTSIQEFNNAPSFDYVFGTSLKSPSLFDASLVTADGTLTVRVEAPAGERFAFDFPADAANVTFGFGMSVHVGLGIHHDFDLDIETPATFENLTGPIVSTDFTAIRQVNGNFAANAFAIPGGPITFTAVTATFKGFPLDYTTPDNPANPGFIPYSIGIDAHFDDATDPGPSSDFFRIESIPVPLPSSAGGGLLLLALAGVPRFRRICQPS